MAGRAIWKGAIHIGRTRLPVKLYSIVEEKNVRFHLLHDQDMVRVKQRLVNPETGETVDYKETEKAAEVDRGTFVKVAPDELQDIAPKESRDIEVLRFVPSGQVGLQWYARPYFLGPDGDSEDYFAFCQAIEKQNKTAIVRWVMRGKPYAGAIRADEGYLVLNTLRFSDDVIPETDLEPPAGRDIDKKERELAEQLIGVLEEDFRPSDYHDEYRERVMELIRAKQKGRKLKVRRRVVKPKTKSLADSLRASLKRTKPTQA